MRGKNGVEQMEQIEQIFKKVSQRDLKKKLLFLPPQICSIRSNLFQPQDSIHSVQEPDQLERQLSVIPFC